jgi:GalNAc-alpha-(1->4)-GalNAc-alpha-(1->3)-diNAcBac-PP-undecaprenol alpha-1,4-N-acetyl-D-galactosaminyltransferase
MLWRIKNSTAISTSDIIISSLSYISLAVLLTNKKNKIICWEHASFSYFRKWFNFLRCYLYKRASAIIVLTKHDKYEFEKSHVSAYVIPNIVEAKESCLPTSNNNGRFLYVGRLSEEKGIDELIQILDHFYKNGFDVDKKHITTIVGTGPLFNFLLKKLKQCNLEDRVELVGRSANVSFYYERADLLLCTSRSESFGLTILEAAQHNVPTISFIDCVGPRSLIINEKTGILIESRDIKLYAEQLKIIHRDSERLNRLGSNAKKMSVNYSGGSVIQSWYKLMES